MKVLRHGNTYKEIECKKCGALLSYCKVDIKIEEYMHTKYISCPECGKIITLKKSLCFEPTDCKQEIKEIVEYWSTSPSNRLKRSKELEKLDKNK